MKRGQGKSLPGYRKHLKSGQAVVTLNCVDHYLGPYGSKVSKNEYDRIIGEWLANGRQIPKPVGAISVAELVLAYLRWAESYYLKDGKPTDTVSTIKNAVRPLLASYGRHPAKDFGPLALQAIVTKMVQLDWSRSGINRALSIIKRLFKFGVAKELVSADVFLALQAVDGLRKGRSNARETKPVLPVNDQTVDATLPHVSPVVADMIRLQRLTGMRPNEVCQLRPCDIDTSGEVWVYRPEHHKTEHHEIIRSIAIGPKGQEILRPYLQRATSDYCFSPREAEQKRREGRTASRRTALSCGNRVGSNVVRKPKRKAGQFYTSGSYRRAITRGCEQAKVSHWSPNQLRHAAATKIRSQFGLEAAQVALGHSNAKITQTYAERDLSKAIEVARQIG
jgi:integrase